MFYQNVRSLKSTYWDNSCNSKESKLNCFHDIVTTNQFDVIALTETWLDSSISVQFQFPTRDYVVHRRDRRQDKLGGGVLLAINDTIKTDPFNFTSKSLELVGAVINSVSKKVLGCACYRPPNDGVEFQQEFNRFLKCASNSNYKDIIILGDFNLPSIKWLYGSGFSVSQ
jgi:exonuclease III